MQNICKISKWKLHKEIIQRSLASNPVFSTCTFSNHFDASRCIIFFLSSEDDHLKLFSIYPYSVYFCEYSFFISIQYILKIALFRYNSRAIKSIPLKYIPFSGFQCIRVVQSLLQSILEHF